MTEDCRNDCIERLLFPKPLDETVNRPGLSRIDYRIGTYADIREALLQKLSSHPGLTAWTHREADDPGIALLEGAAILGDILTFYQDLYANEAYLRTAQWRESVADLVRLVGYRLSPGLGGKATFAFAVKGENPVIVPKGFPIKAQLEDLEKQAEFETQQETVAYPHLSQFHLYRPRQSSRTILAGMNQLEVESIVVKDLSGSERKARDIASMQALNLQPGDRLLLVSESSVIDDQEVSLNISDVGEYCSRQDGHPVEILILTKVEHFLDRTVIEFEGSLIQDYGERVAAYRLGRDWWHFGYNAPAQLTKLDELDPPQMIQASTNFSRQIYSKRSDYLVKDQKYYSSFSSGLDMPLDAEANNLAIGSKIICQFSTVGYSGSSITKKEDHESVGFSESFSLPTSLMMMKDIRKIRSDTLNWGNLSGTSTIVTLNSELIVDGVLSDVETGIDIDIKQIDIDIKQFKFHEVKSPKLTLRAPTQWPEGSITPKTTFNYWGTYQTALELVGKSLILHKEDGTRQPVTVTSTVDNFSTQRVEKDDVHPWLWSLTVTPADDGFSEKFTLADFDEENPTVTVYGNLVEATQGKTEKAAVLGNGDSREIFQTFKLPKASLTYRLSKDETPPEVPEIDVYVSDRRWTRVSSFFGRGPKEEIYIVREDGNGDSWVQFGDGQTGARLPSGVKNIVAQYRTGLGAYGPLKDGTTPQAEGKLDRLQKIYLPGVASGGSQPETGENAKAAAPGKVQSLGRLVSLQDFETEALGISGVSKVVARWDLVNNLPTVVLTVLMESGREAEGEALREIVSQYNRDRGPNRFPIHVQFGQRRYVYLSVIGGRSPTVGEDLVQKAVKTALGVTGEEGNDINSSQGLFTIAQRQFGQPEYATRIEGILQNIEGVVWVRVIHFGVLEAGEDPLTLPYPPAILRGDARVFCPPEQVLSLHSQHFNLDFTAVDATEVPGHG